MRSVSALSQMTTTYLFDTSMLIPFLRKDQAIQQRIASSGIGYVSTIAIGELFKRNAATLRRGVLRHPCKYVASRKRCCWQSSPRSWDLSVEKSLLGHRGTCREASGMVS